MTEYPLECYIKFIKIPYYGIAGMSKNETGHLKFQNPEFFY